LGFSQKENQGFPPVKIRILDAASQDLIEGAGFYEKQGSGLVHISLTHFSPISIHCLYMPVFIPYFSKGITDCLPNDFHLQSIT
jgi:hypothetical protein